jgi:hypothetical protein
MMPVVTPFDVDVVVVANVPSWAATFVRGTVVIFAVKVPVKPFAATVAIVPM